MAQTPSFQRLLENLQTHCVGAIWPMLQAELFEVLRDFCQSTNVFNQIQTLNVSQASQTYSLSPPASAAIKRILTAVDITNSALPPFTAVGYPYALDLPNTFRINQVLQNAYVWQVQYSMYPIDPPDANNEPLFPAWILDTYFDTLFSGCLFRMHAQKAKPYSDPSLAAARRKLYMQGRGLALAEVNRQNTYNSQNWNFPGSYTTYGRQRGV